ncbi:MAG: hypothetical protein AB200_01445 [Parcubacteria bacterium C7867-005]|nr:MAG: hypothetical protein AB200_01445 [Parcubacteria bacterium C7867-005]
MNQNSSYLKVGRSSELYGFNRFLYKVFELVPGVLTWGTIILLVVLSWLVPVWAAYLVILFDLYWFLKTIYMSSHNFHNWRRIRTNLSTDWKGLVSHLKHEDIYHLVIFPFFDESIDVVMESVSGLKLAKYDHSKMIVVLACEERAGEAAKGIADTVADKFRKDFAEIIVTVHPQDISGEVAGKGSNISYALRMTKERYIDANNIDYSNVVVSAFDIDTVVYGDYFLVLTWYYLTTDDRDQASFQPVPIYNNNIWQTNPISRITAFSNTFWQMIQQERPEKLVTFSSHAVSLSALVKVGYWQNNVVSEDSRIFWNLFFVNNGNYRVVPMAYPVSMDANHAGGFWQTMKNIYRQNRRWMWGSENVPYILYGCVKNKNISLWKKIRVSLVQIEGYWSAATNPLIIFLLGWLPLLLGGRFFKETVLSYNLPTLTRNLMLSAMFGLISLSVMSYSLLPKSSKGKPITKKQKVIAILQWLIFPFTIIIFSSIPAIDAQTRLMFGRYMGFWVTPKHRNTNNHE